MLNINHKLLKMYKNKLRYFNKTALYCLIIDIRNNKSKFYMLFIDSEKQC